MGRVSHGALVRARRRGGDGEGEGEARAVWRPEAFEAPVPDPREVVQPEARAAVDAALTLKQDHRVAVAAALRAAGMRTAEIARALGLGVETVRRYLAAARQWGALDDVLRDIDCRLVPQAVENLAYWLGKRDKAATLAVLRGRGVLGRGPQEEARGEGPGALQLVINIVQSPTDGPLVRHALDREALPPQSGELVGAPNGA